MTPRPAQPTPSPHPTTTREDLAEQRRDRNVMRGLILMGIVAFTATVGLLYQGGLLG